MDGFYGNNNSDVRNRRNLSPIPRYTPQTPFYHQPLPVVDPYALPDGHTPVLPNLNPPYLGYMHSARPLMQPPYPAGDYPPSFGYNYHMPSESPSRMEPRSPVIFRNSPAKAVEDVLVMDSVPVKKTSVDKSRSSSSSFLSDSGGSSSSVGKNYKTNLCASYRDNSGYCRNGSACQFAHGQKELRASPVPYKMIPCLYYSNSGTCSYGSKCRYLHSEITTSTSSKVATSTISTNKQEAVTSHIVKLKNMNWYPLDDDVEIQTTDGKISSNEDFDAYVNNLLYGPRKTKRLPEFSEICPE